MTLKQFKRVALLRFGLHGIRSHFARFSPRLPGFLAKCIRHSTAFHPINTETERIFQGRRRRAPEDLERCSEGRGEGVFRLKSGIAADRVRKRISTCTPETMGGAWLSNAAGSAPSGSGSGGCDET